MNNEQTNLDYIRSLSAKQMAKLFVALRYDAAEENDWLEFFEMPYNAEQWKNIIVEE